MFLAEIAPDLLSLLLRFIKALDNNTWLIGFSPWAIMVISFSNSWMPWSIMSLEFLFRLLPSSIEISKSASFECVRKHSPLNLYWRDEITLSDGLFDKHDN